MGAARLAVLLLAGVVAGAAVAHEPAEAPAPSAPAAGGPRFVPPAAGSYELPTIARVEEHWLLDHTGARVPLLGLAEGEVALVSFVYGRCGDACPLALATLQRLDRLLADTPALAGRARLVTVSFDPVHDPPDRMAELRAHMRPRGSWRFLTAPDARALAPVLADFGQDVRPLPASAGAERLAHVLKVFLVDAEGRVRNIYSTGLLEPVLLRNDVATVLGVALPPAS